MRIFILTVFCVASLSASVARAQSEEEVTPWSACKACSSDAEGDPDKCQSVYATKADENSVQNVDCQWWDCADGKVESDFPAACKILKDDEINNCFTPSSEQLTGKKFVETSPDSKDAKFDLEGAANLLVQHAGLKDDEANKVLGSALTTHVCQTLFQVMQVSDAVSTKPTSAYFHSETNNPVCVFTTDAVGVDCEECEGWPAEELQIVSEKCQVTADQSSSSTSKPDSTQETNDSQTDGTNPDDGGASEDADSTPGTDGSQTEETNPNDGGTGTTSISTTWTNGASRAVFPAAALIATLGLLRV